MKFLLVLFLFLTLLADGLKEASRINHAVQEAQDLYRRGQYRQAAARYQFLADSLEVNDDELVLNQAHAAFLAGDNARATRNYTLLAKNPDPVLQSIAFTQLGLIYFRKGNPERAVYTLKKALIQDPMNEKARYNYELLQKYLAANPSLLRKAGPRPPKQPNTNQPQETTTENTATRPDEEGQSGTTRDNREDLNNPPSESANAMGTQNQGGTGTPDTRQPQPGQAEKRQDTPTGRQGNQEKGLSQTPDAGNGPGSLNQEGTEGLAEQEKRMQTLRARLQQANLSPEKATQLLEAMRQAELQYLQQLPRKKQNTGPKTRPDW